MFLSDYSYLTLAFFIGTVHFIALISPGPDALLILRNSINYSRRTALWSAFGLALGVVFHVTYTLFGLAFLTQKMPAILQIIAILGAAYLFYLGTAALVAALRQSAQGGFTESASDKEKTEELSAWQAVAMGCFTNIFNPKAFAYFISFFAVVIVKIKSSWQAIIIGLELVLLTWLWFSLLSFLVSMPRVQHFFHRYERIMNAVIGIAFIAFGIAMLLFNLSA